MRTESEIFTALREVCQQPGFAHAIAYLCFRDHAIRYGETLTADDMLPMFSSKRLIRNEIATLIGLMVQANWNIAIPPPDAFQAYITSAETLLAELHEVICEPMRQSMRSIQEGGTDENSLTRGAMLREAIFYGSESAYLFQYRDLADVRYRADSDWLLANKGFIMDSAAAVVEAVLRLQNSKLEDATGVVRSRPPEEWTMLPGFLVSASEVALESNVDLATVDRVFQAMTLRSRNEPFLSIGDYNEVNAFPLLPLLDGNALLFDAYALVQSLYESPIFWMRADDTYKQTAIRHRGNFTEQFSHNRLSHVFGTRHVHTNVDLIKGKEKLGEIDVLVAFGDRLIVLQAKSKGLTIEARKGSDPKIREDFQNAVQASYDQAYDCAQHLIGGDCRLVQIDGTQLQLAAPPKEIFLFCVVADHYPSLSYQSRELLKFRTTNVIREPFVMDVFLLDAMTEMLESPLRLLGYARQRAKLWDRLLLGHEMTALSFHLKGNLSLNDDFTGLMLGDDISADLDVAMNVRRNDMPGKRTPDGTLTRFAGTPFERLIRQLEHSTDPAAIELGLLLLTLSDATCDNINRTLTALARMTHRDRNLHDATIALSGTGGGITFHSSLAPQAEAAERLLQHCYLKKYQQRCERWFGVCVDDRAHFRFSVVLESPWEKSLEMDNIAATLPQQAPMSMPAALSSLGKVRKIGRNDPCPCGSGKKYKKCHLWKA